MTAPTLIDLGQPTLIEIDDTQETIVVTADSRDATAIWGRGIETGTPADGEVLTYSSSGSEWIYQTVTESIDDRVAALIRPSATGGLTWTYDDAAGTLTPSNSLVNADINASAAIAVSKLASSAVSYGGVSVTLGASDATPAFNLSDATAYPGDSSLVTSGALNSGSISSGFGAINIGSSALTAGAGSFTTLGATDDVTLAATKKLFLDGGGNTSISESAADTIMLTTGGTDRWKVNASGHLLTEGDNNYDIGGSGANRPRDVFIAGTTTGAAASFTTISGSTSLVLASGATVTGIDNGDLATGSATLLATQGAIKTYVDAQVTAQDLDVISDSGNIDIDLDSESLTLTGGSGLDTSATGTTVTWAVDSTVATLAGSQTLTNKTISGSSNTLSNIANSALTNSTVAFGGVSLALGGADTTPAFNLSDATAYTGDSALVTVGTITSGTWEGTTVAVNQGGTGATSLTDGGILLGSGTGAITATSVLGDGEILIGDASGDPVALDVGSSTAITILGTVATGVWNGTAIANANLANSTVSYGGVSLALGASDSTPAFNLSDATAYTGDSSLVTVGTITSGTWNGTAITGAYIDATSSPLANTKIWIGSASNVAAEFALSGDATMTAGGVVTVSSAAACTGNAATATALATARAINGTDFDGTAAITVTAAAGTLTGTELKSTVVTSSLTSVGTIATGVWNGTAITGAYIDATSSPLANTKIWIGSASNVAAEFALSGDATMTAGGVVTVSSAAACTGNAATATALQTARTIGGVSFDGTGNINLPGVNTAGNQDTSGTAAEATVLETARTIGGTSFNGSANIAVALSATATALATARAINGVDFDGTAAITVTAAAGTLSGATLASGVTASSLTSVGTIATGVWDAGAVTSSSTVTADTDVIIGTNPASGGDIRLNKDFKIATRDSSNSADKVVISENVVTGSGTMDIGDNTQWSAIRFHVSTANVMELTSSAINLNKAVTANNAAIKLTGLGTSDPGVAGQLWRSGNDVKISTG